MIKDFWWQLLLSGVVVYLVCNFNIALFLSKIVKHADIRLLGSGNPGTTNVVRNFGLPLGVITFVFDFAKGVLAALAGLLLTSALWQCPQSVSILASYWFGLCAVLGHVHPVFLKFVGGKGIATSLGVFFVIHPIFTACSLVVAFVIIVLTDKVSIFALLHINAQTIFSAFCLFGKDVDKTCAAVAFACCAVMWLVIMLAHRGNIVRLAKGEEKGIGIRKLFFKNKVDDSVKPDAPPDKYDD